ncbi:hypothetical protein FOC89_00610 (plasmid) [Bacillus thuringiensis]|uniref:Uncharacterized protein n=2 Tax=Bacillus thuringiensis TaxID=1428 RepID=A0A0B6BFZ1_BACTU|nr:MULTISPECIES: hypothetical protein [Bacillus]MED1305317.1 hypothetical protein [Bacillus pacificus]PCC77269.1 hypothetical protein CNQ76_23265 [Bacillus cereus]AAW30975.1 conserved hypothetical protein [[Bacillus thuringiensis] serovar konkukian str. 97-27]AJG73697.1 hypothetical protein BF38_6249 [Bacillus thuringiensis]AJI31783.1 hypothetical protein BG06_5435 [Bacillus thuringiensis]
MRLKFWENKDVRKPANAKRKAYLLTLGSFVTMFFVLCISPVFSGATYKFEEMKPGEYKSITTLVKISVARKEYNPANKTLRIDYELRSDNDPQLLSNMKYKVETKYINQKDNNVKTKVYRASDNYIVVISENVPEGFGALSSIVKPEYIHPELQTDPNDLKDRSIKTYVLEGNKIINKDLKVESKDFYEKDYLTFSQKGLNKEIKDMKQKIENKNFAIEQLKIKNDKLTKEMNFQTEAEKTKTKNIINSNISTINRNEKEINELKEEIKMKEKKIQLLNEKKKTV